MAIQTTTRGSFWSLTFLKERGGIGGIGAQGTFSGSIDRSIECEFDVLSLNTTGIGDSFKRRKVFNYLKKNSSSKAVILLQESHSVKKKEKYGITSGDVGKTLYFLHMALQIAVVHLSLLEKDLT